MQHRETAVDLLDGVNGAVDQIGRDFMNRTRDSTFFHSGTNLGEGLEYNGSVILIEHKCLE